MYRPPPPSHIPVPPRHSPSQPLSTTSSTHSLDSTTTSSTTSTLTPPSSATPPSSLPPPLDDNDAPRTPNSTRKAKKVDPPRTPNQINPDQGLSAPQKVRVGLPGLLLTSEAFRNSTGINSSGRTKRDASPGRTRAQNLSAAPVSPTHSRTSSQGSMKARTADALAAKLIPTKNSVHSLIGYIKELQSSEASLRTHLESIKSKAQEDLARSHGAVNKLQSSVRQVEEERDQKALELARKSDEIDALQAKIEALRVALEKNNPSLATNYTSVPPPHIPPPPHPPQMATIQETSETFDRPSNVPHPIPPDMYRGWLVEFFSQHDTSRLPAIDTLMRRYQGRDKRLVQELHLRYGLAAVESLAIRLGQVDALTSSKPRQQRDVAATPAPVPFVMAPEAFQSVCSQQGDAAAPVADQQLLSSSLGRGRNDEDGGRRPPPNSRPPPAGAPPKDYVLHRAAHVPSSVAYSNAPSTNRNPSPLSADDARATPNEPINAFQKPRSPRLHKPRPLASHTMHDPFELNQTSSQKSCPPSPLPVVAPSNLQSTTPTPSTDNSTCRPTTPQTTVSQPPPAHLSSSPPSPPPMPMTLQNLLTDLYKTHQPDKLDDISAIASSYAGREDELVRRLKAKYGALSVKTLELHLPTLQRRVSKQPATSSVLWRVVAFLTRLVVVAAIVGCVGLGYFGVASHLTCRSHTATTDESSYCQAWHMSTSRLVQTPSMEAAQAVLDLVPHASPAMLSVGTAAAARSVERTLVVLRTSIRHIQQVKPVAVPGFRGLELLDEFARVLELLVTNGTSIATAERQRVLDMWAILDLADVEAARQMNWIPSTI
ncbi:hypothetical protein DYB30_000503 [Aphanomyces astaci]|uniref:Transmembrane protein n=4 Tax=Aphanomyces astaci TaxID=112090 RepID=A0A397DGG0_APHAT|nr:hypothetical protein DYB30_000503 [Aphanomyces astaci]